MLFKDCRWCSAYWIHRNCGCYFLNNTENNFICCKPWWSKYACSNSVTVGTQQFTTQLAMSYFYFTNSITSMVPTLQVVYNLLNRNKQDNSVINCTLLALLKKMIKGKKVQSSDSLVGQNGGLLLAPKGQQEGRGGRRLRSPLIAIQQTVAFCSHYQQGCLHWVMTHKPLMLQWQQLQDSSCYCVLVCLCMCSSVHTCVCHSHVFFVCTKSALYTIQRVVC